MTSNPIIIVERESNWKQSTWKLVVVCGTAGTDIGVARVGVSRVGAGVCAGFWSAGTAGTDTAGFEKMSWLILWKKFTRSLPDTDTSTIFFFFQTDYENVLVFVNTNTVAKISDLHTVALSKLGTSQNTFHLLFPCYYSCS